MTPREQEHYEIASSFGPNRPFTLSEFRERYAHRYPERKTKSIMPYEFCWNRHIATATKGPKFLLLLPKRRGYEFKPKQQTHLTLAASS
jgi:hypothetical protein